MIQLFLDWRKKTLPKARQTSELSYFVTKNVLTNTASFRKVTPNRICHLTVKILCQGVVVSDIHQVIKYWVSQWVSELGGASENWQGQAMIRLGSDKNVYCQATARREFLHTTHLLEQSYLLHCGGGSWSQEEKFWSQLANWIGPHLQGSSARQVEIGFKSLDCCSHFPFLRSHHLDCYWRQLSNR